MDPNAIAALLNQLQAHPELLQQMQNNPGLMGQQQVEIPSTLEPKDVEAIDKLKALGFTEEECKMAYFQCNKNEELAANYLLEGGMMEDVGDDNDEEEQDD